MVRFGDVEENELFIYVNAGGQAVLCLKCGSKGNEYTRYDGVRHGVLQLLPDAAISLGPDQQVFALCVTRE